MSHAGFDGDLDLTPLWIRSDQRRDDLQLDKIDRGEIDGLSTDLALELAAAKRRIRLLETELAVSRKVKRGVSRSGP